MNEQRRSHQRATAAEVAEVAGVSVATVSRALRGMSNVSPATAERVRAAAIEVGYRPNQEASDLALSVSRAVSLVLPRIESWYASEVLAGAEPTCTAAGYDTLVTSAPDADALDRIVDSAQPRWGRVDGLIIVDYLLDQVTIDRLEAWECPVVILGEHNTNFSAVRIDDRKVGFDATQHLVELGHRRIALIQGSHHRVDDTSSQNRRTQGYEDALAEIGLAADPSLLATAHFGGQGAPRAVAQLFAQTDPPSALFCMSVPIAVAALRTLNDMGFEVPDDVSIVGVDDQEVAQILSLTTVRQPVALMASMAAELLVEQLNGQTEQRQIVLPTELLKRATSAPRRSEALKARRSTNPSTDQSTKRSADRG